MGKTYAVSVDITMSKTIYQEAENEEDAKAIVSGWIKYNPYEFARNFNSYVTHEITDVTEEDD